MIMQQHGLKRNSSSLDNAESARQFRIWVESR